MQLAFGVVDFVDMQLWAWGPGPPGGGRRGKSGAGAARSRRRPCQLSEQLASATPGVPLFEAV